MGRPPNTGLQRAAVTPLGYGCECPINGLYRAYRSILGPAVRTGLHQQDQGRQNQFAIKAVGPNRSEDANYCLDIQTFGLQTG
jgi:hypothetical protein